MRKISAVIAVFVAVALLASCAARINGSLMGDGQANVRIYAALEPSMERLIRGIGAAAGTIGPESPILDGPGIATSMASAPGIASIELENTTPSAIEGPLKISQIGDFLSFRTVDGKTHGSKTIGFINYEQSTRSTRGRCTINLNLESGPEILALISPDIGDYLSALMAPLATGEILTKADYLLMVSSVYGKSIADEMAKASINATIDFPATIQSVKGGTFSGRKAQFAIPLVDLLVLEKPLSYEVIW